MGNVCLTKQEDLQAVNPIKINYSRFGAKSDSQAKTFNINISET